MATRAALVAGLAAAAVAALPSCFGVAAGGRPGERQPSAVAAAAAGDEGSGGSPSGTAAGSVSAAVRSALLGRRTVNDFEVALPEGWEASLRRAVEAACFAPNHRRTEPWRFHLLGPSRVRAVCELNSELVAAKKGEEAGAKKLARWLAMPGWLVVTQAAAPGAEGDESAGGPGGVLREDYAACCCAVQNLCLSLHSEGLGTKWTTGPVNFHERFPAAAGIPEGEQVVGTIWFGTPAGEPPPPPRKRLSVDDVLRLSD